MSIRMSLNTAPSPFGQRPVSQGRCDSTSPLRNRIFLVLQNCAFSPCLCGWRSTQQEPEDDKRGTIYQTMMSVKESRLAPTLSRNASKAFIDVLLDKCKS